MIKYNNKLTNGLNIFSVVNAIAIYTFESRYLKSIGKYLLWSRYFYFFYSPFTQKLTF